jgi:hypothetical protein
MKIRTAWLVPSHRLFPKPTKQSALGAMISNATDIL